MKKLLPGVLLSIFLLSACTQNSPNNPSPSLPTTDPRGYVEPTRPTGTVLKHYVKDNFSLDLYYDKDHFIYYGSVDAPTPCDDVNVNAIVGESYPEQITLNLTTKDSGQMCAQVITAKKFSGTITASDKATFTIKLRNMQVDEQQ